MIATIKLSASWQKSLIQQSLYGNMLSGQFWSRISNKKCRNSSSDITKRAKYFLGLNAFWIKFDRPRKIQCWRNQYLNIRIINWSYGISNAIWRTKGSWLHYISSLKRRLVYGHFQLNYLKKLQMLVLHYLGTSLNEK